MSNDRGIDVVFVAGPPGAGKTTVAEAYRRRHPGTQHFGTGELVWGIRSGHIHSQYAEELRCAAASGLYMPDAIYSNVVREKIKDLGDNGDTVLVTGFPYDRSDWDVFNETITQDNISLLGAIALHVDMKTSVERIQKRDIEKGMDAKLATSPQERLVYEDRYRGLMGRHAIRLDCYGQSQLRVLPIVAEQPPGDVEVEFTKAMKILKERDE